MFCIYGLRNTIVTSLVDLRVRHLHTEPSALRKSSYTICKRFRSKSDILIMSLSNTTCGVCVEDDDIVISWTTTKTTTTVVGTRFKSFLTLKTLYRYLSWKRRRKIKVLPKSSAFGKHTNAILTLNTRIIQCTWNDHCTRQFKRRRYRDLIIIFYTANDKTCRPHANI